ncbi:hypothetical protein FY034_03085 [Trichlorobacter lovleyi]|nr:hypothetical protein FY034_03085 [Trichlorobacter lovleyi]
MDLIAQEAERFVQRLLAIQDGWPRRMYRLFLVARELLGLVSAERMREAYGQQGSVARLRLRHCRYLTSRYRHPAAWRFRFKALWDG